MRPRDTADVHGDAAYPDFRDGSEACAGVDPEIFFPPTTAAAVPAIATCRECPHENACLEWALATGQDFGVWGGKTARQRGQIKRRRGNL